MNKTRSIAMLLLVALFINSCKVNEQKAVNRVAIDFLDQLGKKNYSKVKKMCTKESAPTIDMLESFEKMSPEKKDPPKIENITCYINGDRASCDYYEEGTAKKLDLVKIRGKWLVEMKKESPELGDSEADSTSVDVPKKKDKNFNTGEKDTTTYFDIGLIDMRDSAGTVNMTFSIQNRSEWNIDHFWMTSYTMGTNGKLIQKNDIIFNGILKSSMFPNLANRDEVAKKCRAEVILDKSTKKDVSEIYLLPVRLQFEPDFYERSLIDINYHNVGQYIIIRNDSIYDVEITF